MPDSATTSYGHAWLVGPASRWCSLLLLTIALDLAPGCGQPQAQQGPAERPAQTADVPLPDWAPKNPSPEFLRALSVLKPIPLEELTRGGGSGPAAEAQALRHRLMWPAAYEFFGTLSDEQIQRFLSSREEEKKILIPMQSLTPKQRRAFDTWVAAFEKAYAGREHSDYLVELYKMGAKRDLSNVEVGFVASGRSAHVCSDVRKPDGTGPSFRVYFATL